MQPQMTRREFLKCSALTAAALCFSACAPTLAARRADTPATYYSNHQDDIVDEAEPFLKALRNRLLRKYDEDSARALTAETKNIFVSLLPNLPYIGGDANVLTATFYQSALALAFYRAMQHKGVGLEESGPTLALAMRALIQTPDVLGGADTRMANSQAARDYFRNAAAFSQKKQYANDWIFEYVEGDGQNFDYGVNYHQCAICQYFRAQSASELVPYLCLGDLFTSQQYETGLVRSTTLASGGKLCDFRFQSGRQAQVEWMPDFLKQED